MNRILILAGCLVGFLIAAPAISATEPREWKDKKGHKVRAELVEFKDGVARLKTPTGIKEIPFEILSDADQAFLKALPTKPADAPAETRDARLQRLRESGGELGKKFAVRFPYEFVETPRKDTLRFLAEKNAVAVVRLGSSKRFEEPVTASGAATVEEALTTFCGKNLVWDAGEELVVVGEPDIIARFQRSLADWRKLSASKDLDATRFGRVVREKPIPAELIEVPLNDVARYISDVSDLNLVLDPHLNQDQLVTVDIPRATLLSALHILSAQQDFRWTTDGNLVFCGMPESVSRFETLQARSAKFKKTSPVRTARALENQVSADFIEHRLGESLQYLSEQAEIPVKLETPSGLIKRPISLYLKGQSLETVLNVLCVREDFEWGVNASGGIVIMSDATK